MNDSMSMSGVAIRLECGLDHQCSLLGVHSSGCPEFHTGRGRCEHCHNH